MGDLLLNKPVSGLKLEGRVTLINEVPATLDLSVDDPTPLTGQLITFTPTFSGIAPDFFSIDFGDGNILSFFTATAQYKYRTPGTFTVRVIAGSALKGLNTFVATDFITATEDDLTAYQGAATLRTWVNFQDPTMLTLNASGELTNINDNVSAVDWIVHASSPTNPPIAKGLDTFGGFKYLQINVAALNGVQTISTNGITFSDTVLMDDPGDEIVIDSATEKGHFFLAFRNNSDWINSRLIGGYVGNNQFLRQASYNAIFYQSTISTASLVFTAPNFQKWTQFLVLELIFNGAGGVELVQDGVTVASASGLTGEFKFALIDGYLSAQHNTTSWIGWSVFTGDNITGANLTKVREYWANKFPSINPTTPPV